MGLNDTPLGNRLHIGFFGKRNAGKSSLLNALVGQDLAVVSDVKGTTTDPVYKTMEFLPLGPVVWIDTPGMDDEGDLGELRINKTKQILKKTDFAILVVDATKGLEKEDQNLICIFQKIEIPYLVVYNKSDLLEDISICKSQEIYVCSENEKDILQLKEKIINSIKIEEKHFSFVGDLLHPFDVVLLVTPIDEAAPKGRLILPQQQVIRDILDARALCMVTKETELKETLIKLKEKPYMVITDSQVFEEVSKQVSEDILLTSFSILMARKKGFLSTSIQGVKALETIQNGDKILISEGCTHHRQCGDIGSVKLPKWICDYTKKKPEFAFCSGNDFPEDLTEFKLVIHCGGCMLNDREMYNRMQVAEEQKIAFTNYGITIAYINGILQRSIEGIPEL